MGLFRILNMIPSKYLIFYKQNSSLALLLWAHNLQILLIQHHRCIHTINLHDWGMQYSDHRPWMHLPNCSNIKRMQPICDCYRRWLGYQFSASISNRSLRKLYIARAWSIPNRFTGNLVSFISWHQFLICTINSHILKYLSHQMCHRVHDIMIM